LSEVDAGLTCGVSSRHLLAGGAPILALLFTKVEVSDLEIYFG
jgi:hypothetical protein